MITFKKLGTHGRLGNQLFQIAFMIGLAKKHNLEMKLPKWEYDKFFLYPVTSQTPSDEILYDKRLAEAHFHYTPEFWDQYAEEFRTRNYDILCWGQSEKYFDHCIDEVARAFEFTDEVKSSAYAKLPPELWNKPVIAISVRQGDYVGNHNYTLLPIKFYLLALLEHFPTFRKDYNLLILSDDIPYCQLHFQCLPNAYFAEGMDAIEQLAVGSQCDHAIIANSTFSWWMAWLIEHNGNLDPTTIVCPNFLFDGTFATKNDFRDFYPEGWIKLDHKIKRLALKNATFTIPVSFDSNERMDNANLSIKYLRDNFDTNIVVGEQGHVRFNYLKDIVKYRHFPMDTFHRTKMLNDMAGDCRTPVIVNWDCDVIVPPLQIIEAVNSIVDDKADMVYPYDGRFARVPRSLFADLDSRVDVGCLRNITFPGMRDNDLKSVGGAIFWKVESFLKGGLENENMISYGPEDAERYDRFMKLGFKIHRVPGTLYHVDHVQSMNSSVKHAFYPANVREFEKVRSMNAEQLKIYIDSWPWAQRYTPSYYESILEESVRSRDTVFGVLKELGVIQSGMSIIDVGCAVGNWGFEIEKFDVDYMGIDFGVPVEKLVIPAERYIDHDLRLPLDGHDKTYSLVLSLEVGEHLPIESADQYIDTLCSLGSLILFSAAIPGQGGVQHVNEQWQSWWAEKFEKRGYFPNDFRTKLVTNGDVDVWYQQNMILYTEGRLVDWDKLGLSQIDFIHPQMYMNLMRHYQILSM